jgi:hypothetical protein
MAEMTVSKPRRLVNPGRRRRKRMTAKQIKFFGTKRQRAALGRKRSNPKRRKRNFSLRGLTRKLGISRKRRKRNVGTILTVFPAGMNPGRKRRKRVSRRRRNRSKRVIIVNKGVTMARSRKRRRVARRVVHHRRRRANRARRRRNVSYVGRIRRGVYKYRNPRRRRRHHNVRRYHRRRNPGMLSGLGGQILGVVGGATLTKIASGFLPASLQTGVLGYLSIGAVAVLQGKLVGKVTKSPALGKDMMVGGLVYLTIKILNDFIPSIGGSLGLSGMGLLAPSSFYVPQVPAGTMGSFVTPAGVTNAMPMVTAQGTAGMGRMRARGRMM